MTSESKKGHLHPLTTAIEEIYAIFSKLGYDIATGPELETEFYNFDALNIPADHPSRDMQDTFWIKNKFADGERRLLRTQTSAVQIRYLQNHKPPVKVIVPGKVYRNEATDATHEAQFHQVEGLLVGENVSLADMKGVLETFFTKLFGRNLKIRLRSSYFPFVEPGVEVDMQCFKCEGKGCGLCKSTGWIEIMGAGMVHPKVLENCGIDSKRYQGFAFGGGVDRMAMLKWGLDDVRLLYNGDLRVVNQF